MLKEQAFVPVRRCSSLAHCTCILLQHTHTTPQHKIDNKMKLSSQLLVALSSMVGPVLMAAAEP